VATKRPRGDVPSEYRATVRVDPRVPALLRSARSPRPGLTAPEGSARLGSARIGSLAFPDPSLTFTRHRAGLRGLPCGTCRANDFLDRLAGLLQLSSLFRALSPRWVSPPLLGFVLFRLSVDAHFGCPLPGARGPPSVEQSHLPDPVPPSRFLTALTASSTRVSRACCIPLPTMRFAMFPSRAASLPWSSLHEPASSPRRAYTPRRIPLASSRTASPRPLPSCRYLSPRASPRVSIRPVLHALPRLCVSIRIPLFSLCSARAEPVRLPPQTLGLARGPRRPPKRLPRSLPGCRSSSLGMPSPPPPKRARFWLVVFLPRRSGLGFALSRATCPTGVLRCRRLHTGLRRSSTLREQAPCANGAAVAHGVHALPRSPAFPREGAGDRGRAALALAKPLAVAVLQPAEADLHSTTSHRPPPEGGWPRRIRRPLAS